MTQPWDDWEDLPAGMYRHAGVIDSGKVGQSIDLLSDAEEFATAAREMVQAWPVAAAYNLRLPASRNSWIGHAACCYRHGASALETRTAWGLLTSHIQRRANAVAFKIAMESQGGAHAETLF